MIQEDSKGSFNEENFERFTLIIKSKLNLVLVTKRQNCQKY